MTHPTDKLPLPNGSAIFLTPCPGTKDVSLRDTIAQFSEQGIKGLVSLTPKHEMEKLGLTAIPALCTEFGINWFYAPIDDHQAPSDTFDQEWPSQRAKVHAILDSQHGVALHCIGGQGRTGTIAAQLLIERGLNFEEARAEVKAVKPGALTIETQVNYLQAFAANK